MVARASRIPARGRPGIDFKSHKNQKSTTRVAGPSSLSPTVARAFADRETNDARLDRSIDRARAVRPSRDAVCGAFDDSRTGGFQGFTHGPFCAIVVGARRRRRARRARGDGVGRRRRGTTRGDGGVVRVSRVSRVVGVGEDGDAS
jgi:hypothetical protein